MTMLARRPMMMRAALGGAGVPVGQYDAVANVVHHYEIARCGYTAYDGNPLVRLRRASDDAEANFTNVSTRNQNLNLAAIAAWAGGASYIVTAFDQVGNDDVTQATAANQPLFTASMQNGHAGAFYDGTNDYLQGAYTNGGALSQPFSVYVLAQLDATVVNDGSLHTVVDGDDATNRMRLFQRNVGPPTNWSLYAGAALGGGASDANWNIWAILLNGASSQFWANAASEASGNAGAHNADGLVVGARNDGGESWKGYIGPIIVADPAHSDAQRVVMQNAINAYWAAY